MRIVDQALRWGTARAEEAVEEVLDWVNERTVRRIIENARAQMEARGWQ